MSIKIADRLMRKSTLMDMSGNIINLIDETTGGYIIKNRQVVDQARWDEIVQKQRDKEEAAKAQVNQISNHNPARNGAPGAPVVEEANEESRVDKLEKKVEGMDSKLDQLLSAISNMNK